MDKIYYKTTPSKLTLFVVTILLILSALIISNEVVLAFISLAAVVTLMMHFSLFESTSDTNKLNRWDLVFQVVLIVVSLFKFMIVSNAH